MPPPGERSADSEMDRLHQHALDTAMRERGAVPVSWRTKPPLLTLLLFLFLPLISAQNLYSKDDMILVTCGTPSRPAWTTGGEDLNLVAVTPDGAASNAFQIDPAEGVCDSVVLFGFQPWSIMVTTQATSSSAARRALTVAAFDSSTGSLGYGSAAQMALTTRKRRIYAFDQKLTKSFVSTTDPLASKNPGALTCPAVGLVDPNNPSSSFGVLPADLGGLALGLSGIVEGMFTDNSLIIDYNVANPRFLCTYGDDQATLRTIGGTGLDGNLYSFDGGPKNRIQFLAKPIAQKWKFATVPTWASQPIVAVAIHYPPASTGVVAFWMWTGRYLGPAAGISVERFVQTKIDEWTYDGQRLVFPVSYTGSNSNAAWLITGMTVSTSSTDGSTYLYVTGSLLDTASVDSRLWRIRTTASTIAATELFSSNKVRYTGIARAPYDFSLPPPSATSTGTPTPSTTGTTSPTKSVSPTLSVTASPTISASRTASASVSPTTTRSPSITASRTRSPSVTASTTRSPSVTASRTGSSTGTPSRPPTPTNSASPGSSASSTSSVEPTTSPSVSMTPSESASQSEEATVSPSESASESPSSSESSSVTETASESLSITASPTESASQSASSSITASATSSATLLPPGPSSTPSLIPVARFYQAASLAEAAALSQGQPVLPLPRTSVLASGGGSATPALPSTYSLPAGSQPVLGGEVGVLAYNWSLPSSIAAAAPNYNLVDPTAARPSRNVRFVKVYAWGAGGGGGMPSSSASSNLGFGGPGAFIMGWIPLEADDVLHVIVGAPGRSNDTALGPASAQLRTVFGAGGSALWDRNNYPLPTDGSDPLDPSAGGSGGSATTILKLNKTSNTFYPILVAAGGGGGMGEDPFLGAASPNRVSFAGCNGGAGGGLRGNDLSPSFSISAAINNNYVFSVTDSIASSPFSPWRTVPTGIAVPGFRGGIYTSDQTLPSISSGFNDNGYTYRSARAANSSSVASGFFGGAGFLNRGGNVWNRTSTQSNTRTVPGDADFSDLARNLGAGGAGMGGSALSIGPGQGFAPPPSGDIFEKIWQYSSAGGGGGFYGGAAGLGACGGGGSSFVDTSAFCRDTAVMLGGTLKYAAVPAEAGPIYRYAVLQGVQPGDGGYPGFTGGSGFVAIDYGAGDAITNVPVSCYASPSPSPTNTPSPSVTKSSSASVSVRPSTSPSASVSPPQGASPSATPTPTTTPSVSSTPSIVLARVEAPPATAIPDTRFYSLVGGASASSSSSSSSSSYKNLVVSEVLPPATFSLIFPRPPSSNEILTVTCAPAGDLASLPGIAVTTTTETTTTGGGSSSSASVVVTASSFASLPSSTLTFQAFSSFMPAPFTGSLLSSVPSAAAAASPIVTGAIRCSFFSRDSSASTSTSTTTTASSSVGLSYSSLPALSIPVKWLSTSWPLFGDLVMEDDNVNVTALRSSWGSSSVATYEALRFSAPTADPVEHVKKTVENGLSASNSRILPAEAASVFKRFSLPASVVNPFTLTISGATTLTLVRDSWQWTNLSSPAGTRAALETALESNALARGNNNASSQLPVPLSLPPHIAFHNGTRVFLGTAECSVLQVSSDGSLLRIRTPTYRELCGGDAAEMAASGSECGVKPLIIVNPSLLSVPPFSSSSSPSEILALARGGSDGAAVEASLLQRYQAIVAAGFPPPAALGGMIGCPQFCPGSSSASSVRPVLVSVTSSTGGSGGSNGLSLLPESLALSSSSSSSSISLAATSAQQSGVAVTAKCTGPQWERIPPTDVCLNASNPLSRNCPFGSGDQCSACPTGAVCPNQRALVTEGFWSASPRSGAILTCPYPSSRCAGYDSVSGQASCALGYQQGSFLCGQCDAAARYYPSEDGDGSCVACPASVDGFTVIRPLLLLAGSMLVIGGSMGVVVLLVSRRNGGTVAGGLRRTAQFVISIVGVLQLVIQVGNAAKPGLPLVITRFYAALSLLQFKGIALHPNCIKGSFSFPFQQEIAEMAIALLLTIVCILCYLNYRRLCGCHCCGVGKKTAAVLDAQRKRMNKANALSAWKDGKAANGGGGGGGGGGGEDGDLMALEDAEQKQSVASLPAISSWTGLTANKNGSSSGGKAGKAGTKMLTSSASPTRGRRATSTDPSSFRRVRGASGAAAASLPSSIPPEPCAIRCGRRMDVWKPFIRRLTLSLMGLLYATIVNACLSLLPCKNGVVMTVSAYLSLDNDGSTILKQYPGTTPASYASPCLDAFCLTRNPLYDKLVTVSLVSSNASFVCYEGAHLRTVLLAWVTFVVFVLFFPVGSFLLVRRRIRQIMTTSNIPVRKLYEASLRNDQKRRRLYIDGIRLVDGIRVAQQQKGACCYSLGRAGRWLCANLCGLGSRYNAHAEPQPACSSCRRCCCAPRPAALVPSSSKKPASSSASSSSSPAVPITDGFLSAVPMIGITSYKRGSGGKGGQEGDDDDDEGEGEGKGETKGGTKANPLLVGVSAAAVSSGVRLKIIPFDGSTPTAKAAKDAKDKDGASVSNDDYELLMAMASAGLPHAPGSPGGLAAAATNKGKSVLLTAKAGLSAGGAGSGAGFSFGGVNPLSPAASSPGGANGSANAAAPALNSENSPSYVLSTNALIDGYDLVTHRNPSLAYFTSGDYRASRHWFRQEDWALLLYLGLLAAFWPNNTLVSSASALGLLVLTVASILLEAVLVLIKRPYTRESQWLIIVRLLTILMAFAAALMNFANEISPLTDDSNNDDNERPALVVILAYVVFGLSVLLAIAVVLSFLWSLRAGARKEKREAEAAEAEEKRRAKEEAERQKMLQEALIKIRTAQQQKQQQGAGKAGSGRGTPGRGGRLNSFLPTMQEAEARAVGLNGDGGSGSGGSGGSGSSPGRSPVSKAASGDGASGARKGINPVRVVAAKASFNPTASAVASFSGSASAAAAASAAMTIPGSALRTRSVKVALGDDDDGDGGSGGGGTDPAGKGPSAFLAARQRRASNVRALGNGLRITSASRHHHNTASSSSSSAVRPLSSSSGSSSAGNAFASSLGKWQGALGSFQEEQEEDESSRPALLPPPSPSSSSSGRVQSQRNLLAFAFNSQASSSSSSSSHSSSSSSRSPGSSRNVLARGGTSSRNLSASPSPSSSAGGSSRNVLALARSGVSSRNLSASASAGSPSLSSSSTSRRNLFASSDGSSAASAAGATRNPLTAAAVPGRSSRRLL